MAFFQNSGQYFNAHVYLYLPVWFPVMKQTLKILLEISKNNVRFLVIDLEICTWYIFEWKNKFKLMSLDSII